MNTTDVWRAIGRTLAHDRDYFVEAIRELMERKPALWFWEV